MKQFKKLLLHSNYKLRTQLFRSEFLLHIKIIVLYGGINTKLRAYQLLEYKCSMHKIAIIAYCNVVKWSLIYTFLFKTRFDSIFHNSAT